MARARSPAGKVTRMIASTCGFISAAVSPCSTRAAISTAGLVARPQSAEAAVKPAMPAMNKRLRPYRSPSRPPVTSRIANARP